MIIMEYTSDGYERLMEYVSCIEKKVKAMRAILEDDADDYQYSSRRRPRHDSRYES